MKSENGAGLSDIPTPVISTFVRSFADAAFGSVAFEACQELRRCVIAAPGIEDFMGIEQRIHKRRHGEELVPSVDDRRELRPLIVRRYPELSYPIRSSEIRGIDHDEKIDVTVRTFRPSGI